MNKQDNNYKSPILNLLIFIFIFGWEGPLAIWMGFQGEKVGLIIVGLFITLFCWGLFGFTFIKDYWAHLFGG